MRRAFSERTRTRRAHEPLPHHECERGADHRERQRHRRGLEDGAAHEVLLARHRLAELDDVPAPSEGVQGHERVPRAAAAAARDARDRLTGRRRGEKRRSDAERAHVVRRHPLDLHRREVAADGVDGLPGRLLSVRLPDGGGRSRQRPGHHLVVANPIGVEVAALALHPEVAVHGENDACSGEERERQLRDDLHVGRRPPAWPFMVDCAGIRTLDPEAPTGARGRGCAHAASRAAAVRVVAQARSTAPTAGAVAASPRNDA